MYCWSKYWILKRKTYAMLKILKEYKVTFFLFLPISFLFAIDGSAILKELGEKQYQMIKGIYYLFLYIKTHF